MSEPNDIAGTILKLAEQLEREALHWQQHPDYFTVRHDQFPDSTHKEAREEIASKIYLHRGTHTDIVIRDIAWKLRRLASSL